MVKRLLFLLLFSSLSGYSQSWVYHPFPDHSLVWGMEHANSSGELSSFIYELKNEDMISGGYTYKKLYRSVNYVLDYTPSITMNGVGAIRQDIPNKKVYFTNFSGPEKLIYDFNLSLGDTIQFAPNPWDTLWVSSIDSVLVGGSYHKRFNLSCPDNGYAFDPGDLIEGVGSTAGLMELYEGGFEFANYFWCYSHMNGTIYPSGSGMLPDCYMTAGIANLENDIDQVKIMPNPSSGKFELSFERALTRKIEVFNVHGQIVYSRASEETSVIVDLSSFSSGIYYLKTTREDGITGTKKLFKY